MIRIGLRFQRRDAALLRRLADRVRAMELGPRDVSTFSLAADAAETGEPLIVHCEDKSEAVAMADGYTMYGVTRPVLDELTGYVAAK
jgi:hypothetical protein